MSVVICKVSSRDWPERENWSNFYWLRRMVEQARLIPIRVKTPTIDPLVISVQIAPACMKRILVDSGSSVNILFKRAYDHMMIEAKNLKPCQSRIHGFNGSTTIPVGMVELPVELGVGDRRRVCMLQFVVLDIHSPYNAFMGQPAHAEFRATIAPWCLTLKFLTNNGVGIVHGDQAARHACYVAKLRDAQWREKGKDVEGSLCPLYGGLTTNAWAKLGRHNQFEEPNPRDNDDEGEVKEYHASSAELTINVPVDNDDDPRVIKIGWDRNWLIFFRQISTCLPGLIQTCVGSCRIARDMH